MQNKGLCRKCPSKKIRAFPANFQSLPFRQTTSGGLCVILQKIFIMIRIELNRVKGDFGFEARDAAGHIARMDSNPESGGEEFGIRPMQMLPMGLGACSGIDTLSILKKQRHGV